MKGGSLRTETLRVRLTPDEKEAVMGASSRENRTMSDWARLQLRTAAGLNGPVAPKGEEGREDGRGVT